MKSLVKEKNFHRHQSPCFYRDSLFKGSCIAWSCDARPDRIWRGHRQVRGCGQLVRGVPNGSRFVFTLFRFPSGFFVSKESVSAPGSGPPDQRLPRGPDPRSGDPIGKPWRGRWDPPSGWACVSRPALRRRYRQDLDSPSAPLETPPIPA
jgi:hypothetical protein